MQRTLGLAVSKGNRDDLGTVLDRCAQGDQVAMAHLYDAVVDRVYGLCVRVLRDHSQAEEVTHESFLEVWRSASRFDPSRGTAQAWILTIVHRNAIDRVRSASAVPEREARYHRLNDSIDYDATSENALRKIEGERVRSALNQLTSLQRQAIELAYFGGLAQSEVAEVLQVPLGTVKTRIRDGLIRLRATLDPVAA